MRVIFTALGALILLPFLGGADAGGYRGLSTDASINTAQDSVYLDRRISMLETRLNSIESSLRSLQQQSIAAERSVSPQPVRDPEVNLLRSEVEILNSRLREIECALVRLDERTLSTSAKDARKRMGTQPADPCRVNPDMPIQLSPRR